MYGTGTKIRFSRVMGRAAARVLDEDTVAALESVRHAEIAFIRRERRYVYNHRREIRSRSRAARRRALRAARRAHPRNK